MEHDLVTAAKNGDTEAFFRLISANKEKLYRIAFSFFRNESDALEAIQEVTCRAFMKLNSLREPAYFETWLVRIMIHYCTDEQKRKKRFSLVERAYGVTYCTDTDTRLGVAEAVDRLKPHYKKIIIMKYFQDLTVRQIAEVLEQPDGTVKTWLHKALKLLRQDLRKGGGEHV